MAKFLADDYSLSSLDYSPEFYKSSSSYAESKLTCLGICSEFIDPFKMPFGIFIFSNLGPTSSPFSLGIISGD
jgi:hypothetical protein